MSKQQSDDTVKTKTKKEADASIAQILAEHRGEQHLIVMHDFPDPDAIAAACAHKLISTSFEIETDIIYTGRISHTQNIALVRLLELELVKYEGELPRSYDAAVFVDNQGTTCVEIVKALEEENIPALIVVDHHEPQERLKPIFSDVRSVGAAATIYAEYLAQGLVELDRADKEHVAVATALMHGLIADTANFIRARKIDFEAAAFLSQFADSELLIQIMSQARSKQVMAAIHKALDKRVVVENFSIVGIGYLRAEDRDAIPQTADFLLTEANVHTAIVYGIVRDTTANNQEESLVGSMRTAKITINPDEFLKEVFGKDEDGRFYGGGKAAAGGFEIPIGFLAGEPDANFPDLKWQVFDSQIKHKIFKKIGVEIEEPEENGA